MLNNTTVNKIISRNGDQGDWFSDDTVNYFTNFMQQDKPLFYSRVGGSDYEVVCRYYNNRNLINDPKFYNWGINYIKNYNGYFDFDNDINNFYNFLENMITYYKQSDDVSYCGSNLINQFKSGNFTGENRIFLNYILDGKIATEYTFLEAVKPFLKSFSIWAKDKKLLFISPLSKSIEHQFKNKDNLYVNYKFPEFELKTYNTTITYSTNHDTKQSLNVSTNNWNDESSRMSKEIDNIDFDIALLSCASYSMSLGHHIKYNLNKKAIYLGGILNVIFNIYGGRFPTYYGGSGLDANHQIDPFENEDIKNIKGGHQAKLESLDAYFGKRS